LAHLSQETIATNLFRDACHNDLMTDGWDQESDQSSKRSTNVWTWSTIYMSAEKVVNWDVPFTGEFQPVSAVPPVWVEVPVGEAWMSSVWGTIGEAWDEKEHTGYFSECA
jgi:hypothetical protein